MASVLNIESIDVYSPSGSSAINTWVSDIIEGRIPESEEKIRFWVHIRDAERAIEILNSNNSRWWC